MKAIAFQYQPEANVMLQEQVPRESKHLCSLIMHKQKDS